MNKRQTQKPSWSDLKSRLLELDQKSLLSLIQDLYAASKDNQAFLHARFALAGDVLAPYKATIHRWICPDVLRNQDYSVSKAKKALSDYKKAVGHPEGLAELAVTYCESCEELLNACSVEDPGYFDALVRMFEQALKAIQNVTPENQAAYMDRLGYVEHTAHEWGYGVGSDMKALILKYGFDEA